MNVSVIVPVYNAEKYLAKCIRSIIGQTYSDLELILVDDGSKDLSGEICDECAANDNRIKVIHQENLGQTGARMAGLQEAHGEYVLFADSDDYLEPEMLEVLMGEAERYTADIVQCSYYSGPAGQQVRTSSPYRSGFYSRKEMEAEIIPTMLCQGTAPFRFGIAPNVWNKLFRKSLALQFMKTVPGDIRNGEDGLFTYQCILAAGSLVIVHEALYHYCSHPESISRRINEQRVRENHCLFQCYWKIHNDDIVFRRQLMNYIVYQTLQFVSSALENKAMYKVRRLCMTVWEKRNSPELISIHAVRARDFVGKRNRLLIHWMKMW